MSQDTGIVGQRLGTNLFYKMLLPAVMFGGGAVAFGQQAVESIPSDRAPLRAAQAKGVATLINDPAQRADAWPAAATSKLAPLDLAPYEAEDAIEDATPGVPYRVGVNRALPRVISSASDGKWSTQPDGVITWNWKLEAPGAQGLSIHIADFSLPEGAQLVIRGSSQLPPVSYRGLGPKELGEFWAQTTMGDTVYVEYQDPTGLGLRPSIVIDEVSHIYRGTQIAQGGGGQRGLLSCQQDVNCHSVDANARDAVGRMLFQKNGGFYVCSGALLNDVDPNTFAGYFLTANHCISSQSVANTLQVWWFYETNSCNGSASVGAVSSGAQLLSTSANTDFTLLRMDDDPDAGQGFAAWTTAAPGGTVRGIHHPGGSFKRFSEGPVTTASPICNPNYPLSQYVYNDWTVGTIEGGSSGSPLFNTSWQVVGQLYGYCYYLNTTAPNCGDPSNWNTLYGRFGVTYPSIAGILNSVTPDDGYEINDSLGQAPTLSPGVYNLRLVDFDDYFTVTACAPLTISATATFSTGAMDLDLFLLNSGGGVLDSSLGVGGSETVSAAVGAGSYRIRADKFSGWGGDYTLTITISGFPDCNANDTPDACEPDCNANGTPDDCEITAMPSIDCNSNNLPDDCDITSGFSQDCDSSGVPDECEIDCNENGYHDSCDIAGATSSDCNSNSIPDDCEVDCDGSGTIDECEIAAGTAEDIDTNGVSDVCQRIFVDVSQLSNPEDGATWDTAYTNLQSGLQRADAIQQTGVGVPTEVWVAQGTYFPDVGPGITPNDRAATFQLISNVELYGGFTGLESELSQRVIGSNGMMVNQAILSGDIDSSDITSNGVTTTAAAINGSNSYNVVTGTGTDLSARIDGFTITGGKADASPNPATGGGMVNEPGSPTVAKCAFRGNYALGGGGMRNGFGASPAITDCQFMDNTAEGNGGGMDNGVDSSPTITNCLFLRNQCDIAGTDPFGGGGAFNHNNSSATFIGCRFVDNRDFGPGGGGGICNAIDSSVSMTDCDFSNNEASEGGAIWSDSMIDVTDCSFASNTVTPSSGGAVYSSGGITVLARCQFVQNTAADGGGAVQQDIGGTAIMTDCDFLGNSATGSPGPGRGGAVRFQNAVSVSVMGCSFSANESASEGGAVYNLGSPTSFVKCRFLGNDAGTTGGACAAWESDPAFTSCLFSGNSSGSLGGALAVQSNSSPSVTNSTFSQNHGGTDGGGMFIDLSSSATILNCVVWGNTDSGPQDDSAQIFNYSGATATVSYTDVQGAWPGMGTNNIDSEPLFINNVGTDGLPGTDDDDLRLSELSPCIDGGEAPSSAALTGWWAFEEGSGTMASDSSGNGLHGTLNGSVSWSDGILGSGLFFDQSNDYVEVAHNPVLNVGTGFTVSFWVKGPALQTAPFGGFLIIDKAHRDVTAPPNYSGWTVFNANNSGGAIEFSVGTGANFRTVPAQGVLDDSWHHVVFTASVSSSLTLKSYVDGALTSTVQHPETMIVNNSDPLLFGTWYFDHSREYTGYLDEVRFFDAELDSGQIQLLADASDLAGNDRVVDVPWMPLPGDTTVRVDMGAYEHQPDCDSNGTRDDVDIASNGAPDCNSNSVIDSCDIQFAISMDIDSDGEPDECDDPMFASIWTDADVGNSNWDDIDNWLPLRRPDNTPAVGMTPAIFYDVTIGAPGGFTVEGSTSDVAIESLTVISTTGVNRLRLTRTLTTSQSALIGTNGRVDLLGNTAELDGTDVTIETGGSVITSGNAGNSTLLGGDVDNSGLISKGANVSLTLTGDRFVNRAGGVVQALAGGGLTIQASEISQSGQMNVSSQVTVAVNNAELVNSNGATISLVGSTLFCPLGFTNLAGGTVTGASGFIEAPNIINEGVITSAGDLTLDGDLTVLPGGSVQVTGDFAVTGSVLDFNFLLAGGNMSLDPGNGNIGLLQGASLTVNNAGTFQSEGATDVIVTGDIEVSALGSIEQSGPTDGMIVGDTLSIGSPDGIGGRVILSQGVEAFVSAVTLVPSPCADTSGLRGCSPPELRVEGNASLDVSGGLSIGDGVSVQVSSTIPVEIGGNVTNASRDPGMFDWSGGGLVLDGLASQTVEIAGQDVGPMIGGFTGNFGIGRMDVENAVGADLVDLFDNDDGGQGACTEALYVGVLTLRPGSDLTLSDVRVYYGRLVNLGGTINPVGCGQLINVPTGDFDGDGDVDDGDYALFADCVSGPDAAPTPVMTTAQQCLDVFDFDDDGDVDAVDYGEFSLVFSP